MKPQTEVSSTEVFTDEFSILNLEDLERYYDWLEKGGIFTIWIGEERGREGGQGGKFGVLKGLECAYAKKEKIVRLCEKLKEEFYPDKEFRSLSDCIFPTLHTVLNRCSDQGRKKQHVQSCRVLAVDLDTVTEKERVKEIVTEFGVGMVVESSPGKFHLYWKVDRTLPLEVWSTVQVGLGVYFGGDLALGERNKSLRAPGLLRPVGDPDTPLFTPRIVYLDDSHAPLSLSEIGERFPWVYEKADEWEELEKERRKELKRLSRLGSGSGKDLIAELEGLNEGKKRLLGGSRNRTLFDMVLAQGLAWKKKEKAGNVGAGSGSEGDGLGSTWNQETAIELGKEISAGLGGFNGKGPLEDWEVEKICKSAYRYVETIWEEDSSLSVSEKEAPDSGELGGEGFEYDYSSGALKTNRFSESAILERVLQRFGSSLVRNESSAGKEVFAFDPGTLTWKPQSIGGGGEACSRVVWMAEKCIWDTLGDPEWVPQMCVNGRGEFSEAAKKKNEEKFLRLGLRMGVVRAVLSSPSVRSGDYRLFDANLDVLHLVNGVIDMRRGAAAEVRPAKDIDYLLSQTEVPWIGPCEKGVVGSGLDKCPGWLGFLDDIFEENEDPQGMKGFLQELFGYSLSGHIEAQKIFCHYGDGCNGKSIVLDCLFRLGSEYATIIDADDVMAKGGGPGGRGGFEKALERVGAKIEGKRIAVIDDLTVRGSWNEGFVKNLTAARIRARAEYEKSRMVPNRCTIHMGMNQPPAPEAENEGILRRMCLIPYPRRFEASSQKAQEIDRMIERELSGIMLWAVEGFRRWIERGGFIYPRDVMAQVAEYREEHFSVENAVRALFKPSQIAQDSSGKDVTKYLWADEVAQAVEDWLALNDKFIKIQAKDISRAIKRVFGISPIKKWHPEKKNMFNIFLLTRS